MVIWYEVLGQGQSKVLPWEGQPHQPQGGGRDGFLERQAEQRPRMNVPDEKEERGKMLGTRTGCNRVRKRGSRDTGSRLTGMLAVAPAGERVERVELHGGRHFFTCPSPRPGVSWLPGVPGRAGEEVNPLFSLTS